MQKPVHKPNQIILSKRANVFYLEHARVIQDGGRVVYLTQVKSGSGVDDMEQIFNIPERNTAFILLGKGTSITDAAIRMLAAQSVVVGFTGSGGSPLHSMVDFVFLNAQSEYRPTEYMQAWMRLWLDDCLRIEAAKMFMKKRMEITKKSWRLIGAKDDYVFPEAACTKLSVAIEKAETVTDLLSAEGVFSRSLYAALASFYKIGNFTRSEAIDRTEDEAGLINEMLDHGNYIAYGFSASALNVLGISFALPLLHGKTRRGALVFDVADIYKDAFVMPMAFLMGKAGAKDRDFRISLIEHMHNNNVLELAIETIKEASLIR